MNSSSPFFRSASARRTRSASEGECNDIPRLSRSLRNRALGSARPRWRFGLFSAALLSLTSSALADVPQPLPVPALNHAMPVGAKRGATTEVTLTGTNLANIAAIRFSHPKLTAEVVDNAKPDKLKLKITIAPDTKLGEHELRVITHGGASNHLRFAVGELNEATEAEPNNEFAQAHKLEALPLTINGQITGEDRDLFRFAAKAGQTLVFEVLGRRLRPFLQVDERVGWFDPCLTLFDGNGRELRFVDDFRDSPDPVLLFTVPADGEYVVAVRDTMHRGRPEFMYRLTLGTVPFVTHHFPLGGSRQSELKLQLRGANVPPEFPVSLVGAIGSEHRVRVPFEGLLSNAVPLALGDSPESLEAEPNDTREQAQRVTLPITLNGRIDKRGDADHVLFTAKKGERVVIETATQQFGSPLDTVLQLLNDKGNQVATNDDTVAVSESLHKSDARIDYTIPADGDYVVRIRDFLNRGGDEFAYRLSIAPPKPDFELRLKSTDPALPNPRVTTVQTIAPGVPAGGSTLLQIEATRRDGFAGEIQVSVVGLPDGFQLSPVTIAANQTQGFVTLTAPENAAVGTPVPLQIIGTAKLGDAELKRTAIALESHSYITDQRQLVEVHEAVLSTLPAAAFALTAATNVVTLNVDGKADLKIAVRRHPEQKGPINFSVQGLPANVTAPAVSLADEQTEATLTLTANAKAAAGMHSVVIVGDWKSDKAAFRAVCPAVTLTLAPKAP